MQIQNVDPEIVGFKDYLGTDNPKVFVNEDSAVIVFQNSSIKIKTDDNE